MASGTHRARAALKDLYRIESTLGAVDEDAPLLEDGRASSFDDRSSGTGERRESDGLHASPERDGRPKPTFRAAGARVLGEVTADRIAHGQPTPSFRRTSTGDQFAAVVRNMSWGVGTGTTLMHDEENPERPGWVNPKADLKALGKLLIGSYFNIFLLCVPLGIMSHFLGWSAYAVFSLNFLALVPLALMLGEVTEDLAVRFGETIGGLLNATFGNIVEMILSIAALRAGLYSVVASSLIGSILSNLLLVLGCCFLFGGTMFKEQSFNVMVNKASCSLLFLSCIGLSIPTAGQAIYGDEKLPEEALKHISHGIAILLALVYICYLFFQLKTHAAVFAEEDGDENIPVLSLAAALGILGAITVTVAVHSEYLTGAIEEVSEKSGLNQTFLGLIILPIAGNACEHITAVFVAVKNKMDLAIGVALGSSIQIAIFVIPVVVIVGWIIGAPFTLDFDPFAVLFLTLSVILAYFVSSDGNSNWLMGVQLVGTYILVALLYLFIHEDAPAKPPGAAPLSWGATMRGVSNI